MDKDLLPYLQEITFAGASVFIAYFLWWKTKLREELIDPATQLLQKDIDRHSARLDKFEPRQDRQENLLDEKMSKINDKLYFLDSDKNLVRIGFSTTATSSIIKMICLF